MNVLVLGAAGFIGVNTVDALRREGIEPLAGRRKRTNVIPLLSRKVRLVEADADDLAGLTRAMEGVDAVIHAAAHYPRYSLDPETSLTRAERELETVFEATHRAGVGRLVFVSSTATVAPAPAGISDEDHQYSSLPRFGLYHQLKWKLEKRALDERRFEVKVACPSACLGPWDLRVGTSALLVGVARGFDPPHPDGIVNFVDARDVGTALARMATRPTERRLILSAGHRRLHELLLEACVRYRVPAISNALDAVTAHDLAFREETRASKGGPRAALSVEICDLVTHGIPISGKLAEQSLGLSYQPLQQTLDDFDEWARRMSIIPKLAPASESSHEYTH